MTKLKDNLFFLNYLKAEKIYFDNEEFNFQLTTHPEYPSLLAYHDALSFFNIPNITVKIEDKDISNLPDYFVGEIQSKLAFVKKKSNSFNVDFGDGKNNDFSIKEFNNLWSGVVLAAENGVDEKKKRKINTSLLGGIFSILFIVVISFFSFNLSIFQSFHFSFYVDYSFQLKL
jgi:ABC-type bacteriocin/lantibiotic exporter with double-glycine peptidase domain